MKATAPVNSHARLAEGTGESNDSLPPQMPSAGITYIEEDCHIKPYALVSHESAVEAIWVLAERQWRGVLDDENIWLVPKAEICVTTQSNFKELSRDVDLAALGIKRSPIDLLVPNKSCYSRGKLARFHVWSDFFPPHSFVRVHERILVSTPYFAVLQLAMAHKASRLARERARTSAYEDARIRSTLGLETESSSADELVRWENIARFARATQVLTDFMGSYRYLPADGSNGIPGIRYHAKPLITPESFTSYLEKMGSSKGIERARSVAGSALAKSASPMETTLALMLSLPAAIGGFGLPQPKLNQDFPVEPTVRHLASQDSIVPDMSWPKEKVAIEYYGWDNHFAAGTHKVAHDTARANSLTALGWHVLHVTFEQVRTLSGISLLARQLACLLDVEMAVPTDLEMVWRARLLALLLPRQQDPN